MKKESRFLKVNDKRPVMMIEVKSSDDNFSSSLSRFHNFLKDTKPIQIVHKLRQKKSKGPVSMLPVHDFLKDLKLEGGKP